MKIIKKTLGLVSRLDFSQQLVFAIIAGFVFLAASTSISIAIINNKSVKTQMVSQASYLTELISRQSRLALLYQSTTAAQEVAEFAMAYPDVIGVEITTESGEKIYSKGIIESVFFDISAGDFDILKEETEKFLFFHAPVVTELLDVNDWIATNSIPENANNSQLIGYVTLVFSKDSLADIQSDILQGNVLVSLLASTFLLFVVVFLGRRMTTPLKELSAVMNRAQHGEINLRTSVKGPKDINIMQRSFNTMMGAIEYRDTELRKARDVALETAEIKSQFAANVSHELRTPMNSVLGMLDLLENMGLSGKQLKYLTTAKASAQNLLGLIDDILSYVHVDSGKVRLEEVSTSVVDLVDGVVSLVASQALRKKIDIGYVLLSEIQDVYLDQQRVKQVLINLIGNAIKFTEIGEVSVEISVDCVANRNQANLVFTVKDTGVGVHPDNLVKIFDAFTQEDATTTRKYGGTGLGLSICKQFAKLMGGDVSAKSTQFKGSQFIFTLPYKPVDDSFQIEEVSVLANRVMIADDSLIVVDFLRQEFRHNKTIVFSAHNANSLKKSLEDADLNDEPFDLLLIDENLPGVFLPDLLRMLRKYRSFVSAKVVILANPWSVEFSEGIEGCVYIEKPLNRSKLIAAIKRPEAEVLSEKDGEKKVERIKLNGKVLIVDDNHANRLVAAGMLELLGCDFDYAQNGHEALAQIDRKHYDLILMDCNMPVLDGYEAARMIRMLENSKSSIPIIAMTANNSPEEFDKCIQAGMNKVLIKPLSLETIRQALISYIAQNKNDPLFTSENDLIDMAVLEKLRESVGEVFESVVKAYIDDLPMYLDALKLAISDNNYQHIYELSHTIKGSSQSLGAQQMTVMARQMERIGKLQDLRGSQHLFSRMEVASTTIVTELKEYLRENSHFSDKKNCIDNQTVVLVADDDRSIRLSMINVLRSSELNTIEAANGQSVLALCSRSMPDVILLDAIMPEMDGFETCKKIRQLPNGTNVPVLIVTSLDDEESITRAFDAGATDFITKPVNYAVLKQRVARLLQTSKTERYVRELAYHDILTGLPNRAFFNQQLRHKISRAHLNEKKMAILFLDLDRFKLINDSLGHDAGDLVLKASADRILRCVRKNDLVARLGGDEFTVVFEDLESVESAGDISKKICDSLRAPFVFLHQRMFISASIGIAVYPQDGQDVNTLVKHADTAMFKAKESGKDFCYYQSGMEDEVTQRIQIERGLRSAIETGEIVFYLQPQVDLSTHEIIGFESLVRWDHPELGVVPASEFIAIAEESGLVSQLTELAFEHAFRQLHDWNESGLDIRLAVNVSGVDFRQGKLSNKVLNLFQQKRFEFPPALLEIEITESILMEQPEVAQRELSLLRDKGITVAIDDFGSGFSSLNYLKRLSVDLLKIDREFIKDCHVDKNDQAIITGIVTLAKNLNLRVIAEGVETVEQADFLHSIGCDYAQGYYFYKPASPEKVKQAIKDGSMMVKRRQVV